MIVVATGKPEVLYRLRTLDGEVQGLTDGKLVLQVLWTSPGAAAIAAEDAGLEANVEEVCVSRELAELEQLRGLVKEIKKGLVTAQRQPWWSAGYSGVLPVLDAIERSERGREPSR